MATIYNLTNMTNSTNIYELAIATNLYTGGLGGTVILTTMYFITLVSLKGWENTDAFAATGFAYGMIGTLFFLAALIPEIVFYFYLVLMIGSLAMLLLRN